MSQVDEDKTKREYKMSWVDEGCDRVTSFDDIRQLHRPASDAWFHGVETMLMELSRESHVHPMITLDSSSNVDECAGQPCEDSEMGGQCDASSFSGGEGTKHDDQKARFDLLPAGPLAQIANVLTYGAGKYTDRNWEKGIRWGRVFASTMRHLWAFWRGEALDKESGLSHLAHAACCVLFLMEYCETRRELDDRAGDGIE